MRSSGLSNLTIIIPTISRPQFVLRQFEYWRVSDAQVVILDGAQNPIEIPEHLKSSNIRYVCTGTRFNERLASAGAYVSTAYCALLPDDEFYLFSGLHAAIARLEADRDLIGCVGRCLGFFVDQGRFLTRDMYRDWKPFSERATTQLARLDEDLPPHKSHKAQFAILRTSAWRSMFENSYRKYFSCGYTYERLLNLQRTILAERRFSMIFSGCEAWRILQFRMKVFRASAAAILCLGLETPSLRGGQAVPSNRPWPADFRRSCAVSCS